MVQIKSLIGGDKNEGESCGSNKEKNCGRCSYGLKCCSEYDSNCTIPLLDSCGKCVAMLGKLNSYILIRLHKNPTQITFSWIYLTLLFNQILFTGISVGQPSYTGSAAANYGKVDDEIAPEIVGNIQSKHKFIF